MELTNSQFNKMVHLIYCYLDDTAWEVASKEDYYKYIDEMGGREYFKELAKECAKAIQDEFKRG